jgi:hypothetical protein
MQNYRIKADKCTGAGFNKYIVYSTPIYSKNFTIFFKTQY